MALIIGLTPVICKAVMAFKEPLIRTNLNVRLRLRTFFFFIFAHLISPWNVIAKKVCCLEIFRREKRFFKFCRLDRGFPHEWNCTAEPKTHTSCTSINFSPWEKKFSCDIFAAICHSPSRAFQVALLIILKCFMLVKQPLAGAPRVSVTNTGCESWRLPAADSRNGSVRSGRKANRAECKICMRKWRKVLRCLIAFHQSEEEAALRQG